MKLLRVFAVVTKGITYRYNKFNYLDSKQYIIYILNNFLTIALIQNAKYRYFSLQASSRLYCAVYFLFMISTDS